MKNFLSFVVLFVLALPQINVQGQSKIENRLTFHEAESWVLYEDYQEALALYLRLERIFPSNYNIKYRIGQCYVNIDGKKANAIPYLEQAVKHINDKYREGSFKETGAPFDAYYLLANAYRINNDIDKALETYQFFKDNMDYKIYDSIEINNEIQSCHNALDLMKTPFYVKETNLGPNINDENSEGYPVVNQDENMLVYSRTLAFYDALLYSEKVNGQWSNPTSLNEALMVDDNLYPTSISNDGKTLFFYSTANYDGIIYSSTFSNGKWSAIKELNDNINTKYWESHASISRDGKKLYFTSNRKGGYGGLDIYVSTWDETTKDWGPAVNLGPTVNTPYNEESPFLCNDDKTLFFSSRGHYNIGGYDILYTTLQSNGEWTEPQTVGYPMNTTDDDVFFLPVKEGYEGYYAKELADGYGAKDIYRVEIFSDAHPRNFEVSGNAKLGNKITTYDDPIKVTVSKVDKNGNLTRIAEMVSEPNSGEYKFNAPHGNYRIDYQADNGQTISRDVELSLYEISDQHRLDDIIVPLTKYAAEMDIHTNKTINVTDDGPIEIPITIEPNASLEVQQFVEDELKKEEKIPTKNTDVVYTYIPPYGDSKLTFTATDKYGNATSADIYIHRSDVPVATQDNEAPTYSKILSNQQLSDFLNMLKDYTDSYVDKIIDDSDIMSHRFSNFDEALDHIKDISKDKGVKPYEINEAALKVAMNDNTLTQAAVDFLADHASGELKQILDDLDIYKENIYTWDDLLKYIEEKSNGRITAKDVNDLANRAINNNALREAYSGDELTQAAITQLAQGADGELLDILNGIDVDALGLKTWDDLLKYIENKSQRRITADDVNALAENILGRQALKDAYYNDNVTQEAIDYMAKYATGELKDILENLDVKAAGIKSWDDLLKYIENKSQGRVTADDVNTFAEDLITKAALFEALKTGILTQDAVDILERYATGELKDGLKNIDIRKEGLKTWDDLMNFVEKRTDGTVTSDEINTYADNLINNRALKDAFNTGKLSQDAISQLSRYADGNLKDILKNLDIDKEGLSTWDDLKQYVEKKSKKEITGNDLDALSSDIIGRQALRRAVYNNILSQEAVDYLNKFALGDLRKALAPLNVKAQGLKTWDDLLDYTSKASNGSIRTSVVNRLAHNILEKEDLLRSVRFGELSQGTVATLKQYSDGELRDILGKTNVDKLGLKTWNDLLHHIEEQSGKRISSDYVIALAQRILDEEALYDARYNNVLTQEAVDILAANTTGKAKEIFEGIDVDALGLKTWDDLAEYMDKMTNGEIGKDELNAMADSILNSVSDIDLMKTKILAYSNGVPNGQIFRDAIDAVENRGNIDDPGQWLKAFVDEAKKLGATDDDIAALLAAITSQPDDDVASWLNKLIKNSDDKLAAWLKSIDPAKEGIKNIEDLIKYILANYKSNGISDDELFDALAKLVKEQNVDPYLIQQTAKAKGQGHGKRWPWWILIAILVGVGIYTKNKVDKAKKNKK